MNFKNNMKFMMRFKPYKRGAIGGTVDHQDIWHYLYTYDFESYFFVCIKEKKTISI